MIISENRNSCIITFKTYMHLNGQMRSIFQSVGLRRRSRNCIDRLLKCVLNRFLTAASVYRTLCRSFESLKSPMMVSSIKLSSAIKAFLRKMTRGIYRWHGYLWRVKRIFDGMPAPMNEKQIEIKISSRVLNFYKACFDRILQEIACVRSVRARD